MSPVSFTTFIIYDAWDKRGADLSQDKIIANGPGQGEFH